MTCLKQRMIEDLQLRGLSPRTQEAYVRVVRQLAEHYDKPPDEIAEEELRQYFLYLTNGKGVSASAFRGALCGIKFFYQYTLKREWPTLDLVRPAKEKKLPVVLSVEEVHQVLGCVRRRHYRVCLTTIYSCGLRLQEGVHLQVADIDSARMLVHVHRGKGAKDRFVPLPHRADTGAAHPGPVARVLGRPPQPDLDIPDHASSRCLLAGGGNQVHGSKFGAKGLEGGCRRERSAQTSYRPHPAAFLCHTSTCPVPGW